MAGDLRPVRQDLIGEAVSATIPSDDRSLYGSAELFGPKTAEVRTWQTFRLVYTTGKLGIDDTGGIRIAFRFISDAGFLQTTDPAAPNYVSARSTGGGNLELKYDRIGGQRPWNETLTVYQRGGYLNPGEQIEITFGETSGGSSGLLMPTFFDSGRVFRVMADVQATGVYVPLVADPLYVSVVAGPLDRYRAALPTLRRPDETFHLGLKAEDIWGNPTSQGPTRFSVKPSMPVEGLPARIDFNPDSGAMTLEGLKCAQEGTLTVIFQDEAGHEVTAGPLVISKGDVAHFWGDLHGQTGETVGTNTVEHYFDFARNKSFLDVTSHQANDFQINATFWKHLNGLTAELNEPGRFTVLPGYEWSGNTAVGGDHNVFYLEEGAPIYRCSHALVQDRNDSETDAHTLTELYAKLQAEPTETVMYAHVGGRYANIFFDHDATLEAAVEMHSAWGSFEWILTDGFPLRRRVGVVCNSDGHKGRPGASYPGASVFGAYGGLTCFVTSENTRESIFETIRRRHTYGTTGPRVYLDVSASLPDGGTLFHRNPDAVPDTKTEQVDSCILGDIVRCTGGKAMVSVNVKAPVGIVSVELRDGTDVLHSERTFGADDLGSRYRVMWSGAEYRGRGRNTAWHGRATLTGGRIDALEPVNKLNPEMKMEKTGSAAVVWHGVTTGNMMGFDLRLGNLTDDASLSIATNHGNLDLSVSELGSDTQVLDAGGLERKLEVMRLPDAPLAQTVSLHQEVRIAPEGDTPVWVCVTLEDGNQVWSSPMYLFRD
ncbi:DUF3604 domain-containing protein [Neptunicoccus cionae]|uniref:DUF3604 domain-containing protein n=1 Tax=Neptunicoccus cionae TaxID=2035344 RepID=UPI000C760DAC|nr:DUF3604 domain-containing protein [Amylibacter cionae]PLS21176.1 DUF3604 domain-containing protein [Amylibacter cionae]